MSGWWIQLGDTHVRCDRPEHTADFPYEMARCLTTLFSESKFIEDDEYGPSAAGQGTYR